jgi:uncharacterized membrane protein
VRWISLGVLLAAAALLLAFWGDVPARWTIHWGVDGRPDGWATKNQGAALAPLVFGFFAWLLIEVTAAWIGRGGQQTPPPPEMRAVQATLTRAVGLGVAILIAGLTLALPFAQPRSSGPMLIAALAILGLTIGIAGTWASRRVRRLRDSGVVIPEGYGGLIYKNPRDSRLWVPKLAGIGWTINFAHRLAWPVTIAIVALPLVLVVAIGLAAR